jgi:hypothetical protein
MDELGHLGWVAHQSYELEGRLVGIRTDSNAFARWLAEVLPATLLPDEAAEPNYSVVIGRNNHRLGKRKPGKRFHVLYKDSTALSRTFDVAELVSALLADLTALTYMRRKDAVYLQAAFLSDNAVCALFPEELVGSFEAIKRHVQATGLRIPESRFVAVDLETAEVFRPPRSLEVDADEVSVLGEEIGSEPTAWPRAALDRRRTIDLICTMGSPSSGSVQPVSRGFALYVLASNAPNMSMLGHRGLEALRTLVERASCWEIAPREPRLMVESVLELMHSIEPVDQVRS